MTTPRFTAKSHTSRVPPGPVPPGPVPSSPVPSDPIPPDFQLPDRPEREPDDMTSFDALTRDGTAHYLREHLGNHDSTLVAGDRYVVAELVTAPEGMAEGMAGARYPDLLVAFEVDPAAYQARNGYVIAEQGKPPDFVLEVASRRTGREDVEEKPASYAALGIPEYWRFDESGRYHGARLAGERLLDGEYEPIAIDELPDGSLEGYSAVLNVNLRWEGGELRFYDPATGRPVLTMADAQARAAAAEARVRELEELLRRRNP